MQSIYSIGTVQCIFSIPPPPSYSRDISKPHTSYKLLVLIINGSCPRKVQFGKNKREDKETRVQSAKPHVVSRPSGASLPIQRTALGTHCTTHLYNNLTTHHHITLHYKYLHCTTSLDSGLLMHCNESSLDFDSQYMLVSVASLVLISPLYYSYNTAQYPAIPDCTSTYYTIPYSVSELLIDS